MSKIRPPWGSSLDWWPPQPKKIEKKIRKKSEKYRCGTPEGPIFGLVGRKKNFFSAKFFFSTCRKSGHPGAAAWTGGHPNQKKSKKNPKKIRKISVWHPRGPDFRFSRPKKKIFFGQIFFFDMSKIRPPWGSSLDWWPPQPKKIEKKSEKNPKNIGVAPQRARFSV